MKNFGKVKFLSGQRVIFSVGLHKINLDYADFCKDDPETIIHVRLLVWRNKFEKHKAFKKDITKELMSVA